jgi:hypothetical protein
MEGLLAISPQSTVLLLALVGMGETMVEIREFSNAQTAFDPDAIQILASALEDAWGRVQKSGSRFARPAYARAIREVLAKRIIEVAQRGEKDKLKLAADALNFLVTNYVDNSTRKRTAAKHGVSQMFRSPKSSSTHDAV